ncbi:MULTISPECIES: beta-ketoacyl synthase N-terminal-like domain-containing protein [unclassified Streptomyces]|uniref:beta-ketoacyl synthase N-terminal-like domain-containing protein n=1 Tax=unclassified Streptomyces TaxID=2593676 RepID=UPI002E0FA55E|nr:MULTISPECIES: beta-ketoacyl synthase N-terminal-like domain-containing protein [unclassified Streptomyces]WSR29111.1 3-oxoacyl-ACP synthase [Streptomyces sp. NBC_01205]
MLSTGAGRPQRPVITAWSAVSPFGVGREPFERGLSAGRTTARRPDTDVWGVVAEPLAHLVPDFEVRQVLGKAGTRGLDRATGLAITAVRELLRHAPDIVDDSGLTTGIVLGTTAGSAQGYADVTRASFEGRRPQDVPPVAIPNMAMNRATSASAIFHGLRGPNSTLAAGRVSGLMALEHGRRLLAQHRADRVVVGATEEYSQARSWLEHHRRHARDADAALGEGSAVLLLERPDGIGAERTVLAEVLAVTSCIDVDGDPVAALRSCLSAVLDAAAVAAGDVWAAMPSSCGGTPDPGEARLLKDTFGTEAVSRPAIGSLIGDTSAAASLFQIAALLSTAQHAADDRGHDGDRLALVSAVDPDGAVACALLRLPSSGR